MKRPKNKYALVVVVVVFVVAAGFLYYFLDKTSTEVVGIRKTLFNLREEAREMATLERRHYELVSEIDTIAQSLPETTMDIASYLAALNEAANTSGITIATEVEGQQKKQDTPEGVAVNITMTISGSYVATTQFISKVSNLPYYFNVLEVNMQPDKTGSGISTTFTIGLITSYHET